MDSISISRYLTERSLGEDLRRRLGTGAGLGTRGGAPAGRRAAFAPAPFRQVARPDGAPAGAGAPPGHVTRIASQALRLRLPLGSVAVRPARTWPGPSVRGTLQGP